MGLRGLDGLACGVSVERICAGSDSRGFVTGVSHTRVLVAVAVADTIRNSSAGHRLVSTGPMAHQLALPLALLIANDAAHC
jgi:hypothetical protein